MRRGAGSDLAGAVSFRCVSTDVHCRYMLDRLKSLCEMVVQRSVSIDNIVHRLIGAHKHNAASLKVCVCVAWVA